MNELDYLKTLVKTSNKPVEVVIEEYFKATTWSLLKDEWTKLSKKQKTNVINKLQGERK